MFCLEIRTPNVESRSFFNQEMKKNKRGGGGGTEKSIEFIRFKKEEWSKPFE